MSKPFIFIFMIFCHIIDDYTLQGWLANAKQKIWWFANAPDKLYKYDWIMALAMHSMSWSFMIMLPIAIYLNFEIGFSYICLWIANSIFHGIIDNAKANEHKINLICDQTLHLLQILITFLIMVR